MSLGKKLKSKCAGDVGEEKDEDHDTAIIGG